MYIQEQLVEDQIKLMDLELGSSPDDKTSVETRQTPRCFFDEIKHLLRHRRAQIDYYDYPLHHRSSTLNTKCNYKIIVVKPLRLQAHKLQ